MNPPPGEPPISLTIQLGEWQATVTLTRNGSATATAAPTEVWAAGPAPKHLGGFSAVYWPTLGTFHFTPKQAKVIAELWAARLAGTSPAIDQQQLLRAADSDGTRLRDLFRGSDAWDVLIIPGRVSGSYQLPEMPG